MLCHRTFALLVLLATAASVPAAAQPPAQPFPGTPFVEPVGPEGLLPASFAGELLLQSGGQDAETPTFFILRSPDGDKLWGYSTAIGEWQRASLDDDAKPGDPILGSTVAVVVAGRKIYAFSSIRGEWKSLEIPGKEAIVPIVSTGIAVVAGERKVLAFSSQKGEWQTLDVPGADPVVPIVGPDYVKIGTKESLSIFSGMKGNWSTVKLNE